MSPRVACRLESLGFVNVFDYVAGKEDWIAKGLPIEGTGADVPRVGDVCRSDPPTCSLTERIGDVLDRVTMSGWDTCVVVNEDGCILGRLRDKAFQSDPEVLAETVMESGPTTQRPDVLLGPLTQRMRERNVDDILVSGADGRLVGILYRADVERLEEAARRATWKECVGCRGTWRVSVTPA